MIGGSRNRKNVSEFNTYAFCSASLVAYNRPPTTRPNMIKRQLSGNFSVNLCDK
jgi:hypothetical protein